MTLMDFTMEFTMICTAAPSSPDSHKVVSRTVDGPSEMSEMIGGRHSFGWQLSFYCVIIRP